MATDARDCNTCTHRTHDMDEAFCGHPESFKAESFGLNFNAMRRVKTGPCGPEGKFYLNQYEVPFE